MTRKKFGVIGHIRDKRDMCLELPRGFAPCLDTKGRSTNCCRTALRS